MEKLLPIWQYWPTAPCLQVHVKLFTKLLQVPLFKHGLLAHSFTSKRGTKNKYYTVEVPLK